MSDYYDVETDDSLRPEINEVGIEIIGPPQKFQDLKNDYLKLLDFMGKNGAYTNDSCGLHVNISLLNYDITKLDYVKLIIFLGDNYVLKNFDRMSNTYTASSMDSFSKTMDPGRALMALDALKTNLNTRAGFFLSNNVTSKYSSVNIKRDRVEFRAPGGNWMEKDPEFIFGIIARMIFALHIALDNTLYQKQYASRLYRVIHDSTNSENNNATTLFSMYSAGLIGKDEIRRSLEKRREARAASQSGSLD